MIDYDRMSETMNMICNDCGYIDPYVGKWRTCIDDAKMDGWKLSKNEYNKWEHRCPGCSTSGIDRAERDFFGKSPGVEACSELKDTNWKKDFLSGN